MELGKETTLYKANPVSLESEEAIELKCVEGQIWLTIAGYGEDFILTPGQRFLIAESHGVVLESLAKESRLQMRRFTKAA